MAHGTYRRPPEGLRRVDPPSPHDLSGFAGWRVIGLLEAEGERYARYAVAPPDPAVARRALALFVLDAAAVEGWFLMRFQEARITMRLRHENLGGVLEMDSEGPVAWHLAEYPRGDTVEGILAQVRYGAARPGPDVLAAVLADFAAGLHAGHTSADGQGRPYGFVYRDLRPASLLVSREGKGTIVDWGLDLLVYTYRTPEVDGRPRTWLRYLAPEQVRGASVGSRTDVFALGVILHELATGSPLFTGETDQALIKEVLDKPAPLLADRVAGCPPELSALADRALAKYPAARPSAGEIAEELRAGLAARGVDEPARIVAAYLQSLRGGRRGTGQ
jgi:serine/threonine protein kinase